MMIYVAALKADRKKLKSEKYDLLNQMKQLYATLDDKEKELRDFIRTFEQVFKQVFWLLIHSNIFNSLTCTFL